MVMPAESGCAVVVPAGGNGLAMEQIDGDAIRARERDVNLAWALRPEIQNTGLPPRPKPTPEMFAMTNAIPSGASARS